MTKEQGGTALVTGASCGIGYELAKLFAQDGHDLVLVARSRDKLNRIAREFTDQYGVQARVIVKDLFERSAAREVYDEVRQAGIDIKYLVNDAGQGVWGKFADTDLVRELAIIQLNVVATVTLTKLFLKDMLARDEGRILQVASMVSKAPTPYQAMYSATKAFIYNFSQAVRGELEGTKVTMTALRPGATDTDFFRKAGAEEARIVQDGKLGPASKVAADGYAAMMRGDDSVISGFPNKVQDAIGAAMPDRLVAKASGRMQEPKPRRNGAESQPDMH